MGSMIKTADDVLWYSVFATNDATAKLGGNPFDNHDRWYFGSGNDLLLNLRVPRFTAAPAAIAAMRGLDTSGNRTIPLVTMHTTGDDIIPFWHESLYAARVHTTGHGSFTPLPVFAYGHCNFTTLDLLGAFGVLPLQVAGESPQATSAQAQQMLAQAHQQLARQGQDRPADQVTGRP